MIRVFYTQGNQPHRAFVQCVDENHQPFGEVHTIRLVSGLEFGELYDVEPQIDGAGEIEGFYFGTFKKAVQ